MTGDRPAGRDPFSRYRDQLAAVGFRPSTSRGQNFLLDPSLHRWIAEQAAAGPEAKVAINRSVAHFEKMRSVIEEEGALCTQLCS